MEDSFAELKTDLPSLLAQALTLTGHYVLEAPQNGQFIPLSKEIDFAADLVNRGLIGLALTKL